MIDLTSIKSDQEKWKRLTNFLQVDHIPIDREFPYESHIQYHLKQIWGNILGLR